MAEFIDPVFAKTSPKRAFSMTEDEHFELVFAKTGYINSGTGISAFTFWSKICQNESNFIHFIQCSRRVCTAYPNSASTEKCIVPIQPFYWRREKGYKTRERDKIPLSCSVFLSADCSRKGGGGCVY